MTPDGARPPLLAEELAKRFGGGRIAQEAAARVLRQRAQEVGLFEQRSTEPVHAEQVSRDLLDEEAFSPSARWQLPVPRGQVAPNTQQARRTGAQQQHPGSTHGAPTVSPSAASAAPAFTAYNPDSYPYRTAAVAAQPRGAQQASPQEQHAGHGSGASNSGSPMSTLDESTHALARRAIITTASGFHAVLPAQRPGSPLSRSASPHSSIDSLPHSPRTSEGSPRSPRWNQPQLVWSQSGLTQPHPPPAAWGAASAASGTRAGAPLQHSQAGLGQPTPAPAGHSQHAAHSPEEDDTAKALEWLHAPHKQGLRHISTSRPRAPPQPAATVAAAAKPAVQSPVTPAAHPRTPSSALRPASAPAKRDTLAGAAARQAGPQAVAKRPRDAAKPAASTAYADAPSRRPLSASAASASKHPASAARSPALAAGADGNPASKPSTRSPASRSQPTPPGPKPHIKQPGTAPASRTQTAASSHATSTQGAVVVAAAPHRTAAATAQHELPGQSITPPGPVQRQQQQQASASGSRHVAAAQPLSSATPGQADGPSSTSALPSSTTASTAPVSSPAQSIPLPPPAPQLQPSNQASEAQPATELSAAVPAGEGQSARSAPAAPRLLQADSSILVETPGQQPPRLLVQPPASAGGASRSARASECNVRTSSTDEVEELAELLNSPALKKELQLSTEGSSVLQPPAYTSAAAAAPCLGSLPTTSVAVAPGISGVEEAVPAAATPHSIATRASAGAGASASASAGKGGAAARHAAGVSTGSPGVQQANARLPAEDVGTGVPDLPRSVSPGPPTASDRTAEARHAGSASVWRPPTGGGFVARSADRLHDAHEASEEYFKRFRVKKHRDPSLFHYQGRRPTPDYKFSQPASRGPQVTLQQVVWSFDDAHPALAGSHCSRTKNQDALLVEERRQQRRAALHEAAAHARWQQQQKTQTLMARSRGRSCDTLASKYEQRLADLQQVGKTYKSQEVSAEQRAKQAMAASAALSARHRSRSRSPSPGFRSPSPLRPASAGAFPLPRMMLPRPDDRYVKELEQRVHQLQDKLVSLSQGVDAPAVDDDVAHAVDALHSGHYTSATQDASHTLADHLAVLHRREDMLLDEEELIQASGAYHPSRFEEYAEQLQCKRGIRTQKGLERGSIELGYESDVEEEEAQRAEQDAQEALADLEEANYHKHQQLAAQWEEDNTWMDEYRDQSQRSSAAPVRQRTPPQYPDHGDANEQKETEEQEEEDYWDEDELAEDSARHSQQWAESGSAPSVLSEEDEWLLQQPYVPTVSPDFQHRGSTSDNGMGHRHVDRRQSPGYHSEGYSARCLGRRTRPRFSPTVPKPFEFEERARQRPKPIAQVKLEQDLALKRQEAEAAKKRRFHANPVPSSTLEARYQNILAEQEYKRMLSHERNAENLRVQEQPFSFYARDANKRAAKAAISRDPNRFQIKFRAKPIPAHVKETRFMMMMAEAEAQKAAAQARLEAARAKSRLLREQQAEQRRQEADEAYQQRLHETKVRRVDPVWNQKYDTKPLGAVPDFNLLHVEWERQQASVKASNRRHVTVPQEFSIHGGTLEEAERRARKHEERRQRMLMEMALDEQNLTEMRWPYKSRRAKVRPTPPPAFEQPDTSHADTKANRLRIAATRQAILKGQYASKETKEQQALEHAKRTAAERARMWTKMQQRLAAGKLGSNMGNLQAYGSPSTLPAQVDATTTGTDGFPAGPDGRKKEGTLERREKLRSRSDAPVQHIEARHRQAELLAKQEVEAVLLAQGLDVYKYVEG